MALTLRDYRLVERLARRAGVSMAEYCRSIVLPVVRELAAREAERAATERIGASGEQRRGPLIELDP